MIKLFDMHAACLAIALSTNTVKSLSGFEHTSVQQYLANHGVTYREIFHKDKISIYISTVWTMNYLGQIDQIYQALRGVPWSKNQHVQFWVKSRF